MVMSFIEMVKKETGRVHQMIERTGFIGRLFQGEASRSEYAQYLTNLYYVYRCLEEGLTRHRRHAFVDPIFFPELHRTEALEKDLTTLLGSGWKQIEPLKATRVYVGYLTELTEEHHERLAAHAFVRYLIDLSQSEFLYKLYMNQFRLKQEEPAYHRYENIPDIKGFLLKYHSALESLPLENADRERFIQEILLCYFLNLAMSIEMDADNLCGASKEEDPSNTITVGNEKK
jgi:heme oxygenase